VKYYFLLIDFGASRVKTVLLNTECGEFSSMRDYTPVQHENTDPLACTFSVEKIIMQFQQIVRDYADGNTALQGIFICSQMHGFAMYDGVDPVSAYISWKDERTSIFNEELGASPYDYLNQKYAHLFKAESGMKLRQGLPFVSVFNWALQNCYNKVLRMLSLPDIISENCDKCFNVAHPTMLAGFGFYDVKKSEISRNLVNIIEEETGLKLSFNDAVGENVKASIININGRKIPVYAGVGDHQCSVYGAGLINGEIISFNLGTGSQVTVIDSTERDLVDNRPYFNDQILATITHIPSGRALDEYIGFLYSIDDKQDHWALLASITEEEILNAPFEIDLGIFHSAWNYCEKAGIRNIRESSLNKRNYCASLLKSYVLQYEAAVRIIDKDRLKTEIVLSGGIPKKIKALCPLFEKICKRKCCETSAIDETFVGLKMLSENIK
jgi:sugar (pentulose or hexulose) kinase